MPRGRGTHDMMLGKSLALPDLRFPSSSLRASCWLRNYRMLSVGLFQKHSPPRHSHVSDATLLSGHLRRQGRPSFWMAHSIQLCQALGIHW